MPTELDVLKEHLRLGTYMFVSTWAPWSFTCWYDLTDDLEFVFLSKETRRHSGELRERPDACGAVLNEVPEGGPGNPVKGVYFEGPVECLRGEPLARAYEGYANRWRDAPDVPSLDHIVSRDNADRLWMLRPTGFVLFDAVNFPKDPRREIRSW